MPQCHLCNERFDYGELLIDHLRSCHKPPKELYHCFACGADFYDEYKRTSRHDCPASHAPVKPTFDPVNRPSHYNQGKFEVWDVIEDNLKEGFEAYLVGNILKYMMRYKHKNGIQDLEKAEQYLKRLIQTKKRCE